MYLQIPLRISNTLLFVASLLLLFVFPNSAFSQTSGADPRWFMQGGQPYEVSIVFNSTSGTIEYLIKDSAGVEVALSKKDEEVLAWAYEMSGTGYLDGAQLDELKTLRDSVNTVENMHYAITGLAELQDKLMQLGVVGTAIFFGKVDSAGKVILNAALDEIKDTIVQSPQLAARAVGRALMKAGLDRLDRLIEFSENSRQLNLGQSPSAPLDAGEVHARYKDAVFVDTMVFPAADLAISTQRKADWKSQTADMLDVVRDSVVGLMPGSKTKATVETLIMAGNAVEALAQSSEEFEQFMNIAEINRQKWENSPAGLGDNIPDGFQVESTLPSGVLANRDPRTIDRAEAEMVLPYAYLSLIVYDSLDGTEQGWERVGEPFRELNGFSAALYHRQQDDTVVLCFEGTKPLTKDPAGFAVDMYANLQHIEEVPLQYKQGLALAREILDTYPGIDLKLTGHSLGGGIAQYVAGRLGLEAFVFNPAGLWVPTLQKVLARETDRPFKIFTVITQGFVIDEQYHVKDAGDPVSKIGAQLGKVMAVPLQSPSRVKGFLYRHEMEKLYNALRAITRVPQSGSSPGQNIVAVVDSSGSMKETDPRKLRISALKMMIDSLSEENKLGIIDFDDTAKVLSSLTPLGVYGSDARNTLRARLGRIDANGQTNIRAGLEAAASEIPVGDGVIILLTDGRDQNWNGQADMLRSGIKVHTIALSDGADKVGLSLLSSATGGEAEIARDSGDIQRIFGNLFGLAENEEVILVREGIIQQGGTVAYDVYVERGQGVLEFRVTWPGSDIDIAAISPDGRRYSIDSAVSGGYGVEGDTYDIIRIEKPMPGNWNVELTGKDIAPGGEPYTVRAAARDSLVKTAWKINPLVPERGENCSFSLSSQSDVTWQSAVVNRIDNDGNKTTKQVSLSSISAMLGGAGGQTVYSWRPDELGTHRFYIEAKGVLPDGSQVVRSLDRTIRVAVPGQGVKRKHEIDPFIRRW